MKVLLVLLALALPASASAHKPRADYAAAVRVAEAVWPNACAPTSKPRAPAYPDWTLGYASWIVVDDARADCALWLNPDWRHWNYWLLCATIVHEYGHLSGAAHSNDPSSIMYPKAHRLRECRRRS